MLMYDVTIESRRRQKAVFADCCFVAANFLLGIQLSKLFC